MTITPLLTAEYQIPGAAHIWTGSGAFDLNGPRPRVLAGDPEWLRLYELGNEAELLASYPRPSGRWQYTEHWIAPDLSYAVFMGEQSYQAVARDGTRIWEQGYGGWDAYRWGDVTLSADGSRIWLRLPSGVANETLFLTLDATGTVLARSILPCGGYERHVQLGWTEGDELVSVSVVGEKATHYEAVLVDDQVLLGDPLPLPRSGVPGLVDVSPSGEEGMEVDDDRRHVRWHRLHPEHEVIAELSLKDFPKPGTGDCDVHNRPYLQFSGGYVDAGTALVHLYDDYDEARTLMVGDRWQQESHWLADPATRVVHGRIAYPGREAENVKVLGDGTWLTTGWDTVQRWSAPTMPAHGLLKNPTRSTA
ncbi:hypothetical protein AB0L06_42520 [Spirillospora sp. NPDC052269]